MKEILILFLRLGLTAFGGPAVHLAMMRDEVVRRRKWFTDGEFLDMVGLTGLIPGPNSTEMAMHVGLVRRGWKGLLTAGLAFIVPAATITLVLAMSYVAYGMLPDVASILAGLRWALVPIVLVALAGLASSIASRPEMIVVAMASALAAILGMDEVFVLLCAGSIGTVAGLIRIRMNEAATTGALLWFFLKTGSVLYGSGYVLVAYLDGGLVRERGWLTARQLADAVAVGQFTPGPVLSTATFVGYLVDGLPGAVVSTLAIFAPSFVFVGLLGLMRRYLASSQVMRTFLDAVNAASLGLMVSACWTLARTAYHDTFGVLVGAVAFVVLWRWKVNPVWVMLAGAVLSFIGT